MSRDRLEANRDKRRNVITNEAEGKVADSLDVRMVLMEKVRSGECTLAEVQKELKKIKRNAKKNGQITRSQAFNAG